MSLMDERSTAESWTDENQGPNSLTKQALSKSILACELSTTDSPVGNS